MQGLLPIFPIQRFHPVVSVTHECSRGRVVKASDSKSDGEILLPSLLTHQILGGKEIQFFNCDD